MSQNLVQFVHFFKDLNGLEILKLYAHDGHYPYKSTHIHHEGRSEMEKSMIEFGLERLVNESVPFRVEFYDEYGLLFRHGVSGCSL
jgi:hypothetical protein